MTKSINFDSFFSDTAIDNNGNNCTDINKGIDSLFDFFNQYEDKFYTQQRYLVTEGEDGYPDLVAYRSMLKSEKYWWWVCFLNKVEDPLGEFGANWVYSITSQDQISSFIAGADENDSSDDSKSIIGQLVSLN